MTLLKIGRLGFRWVHSAILIASTASFLQAASVPVFHDDDLVGDEDGAAALAFLFGLEKKCEIRVIGITGVTSNSYAAGFADAVSRYFGRPNIPIGQIKGKSIIEGSEYSEGIAKSFPNRYCARAFELLDHQCRWVL